MRTWKEAGSLFWLNRSWLTSVGAKLAAKTVLDFQLNRYGSCHFTRWLRFGKKPKTVALLRIDIARL
jgi:hypothetical protein